MDININKLKPRKDIDALQDEFDQVKKQCRSTCPRDNCWEQCQREQGHIGSHAHIIYDIYLGNKLHRWRRR